MKCKVLCMKSCVYPTYIKITNMSYTLVCKVTMASITSVVHLQQKWQSSFDEDDELYQWHPFHEPIEEINQHMQLNKYTMMELLL